jgi:hypothetical protein
LNPDLVKRAGKGYVVLRGNSLDYDEFKIDGSRFVLQRSYTQLAPNNIAADEIVPSPDGKRIAWQVSYDYENPVLVFLHKISSSVQVTKQHRIALWIKDPENAKARELGYLVEDNAQPNQPASPNGLAWTPDGKSLSFLYDNALWTLPVD